jgi:hypothetical protein
MAEDVANMADESNKGSENGLTTMTNEVGRFRDRRLHATEHLPLIDYMIPEKSEITRRLVDNPADLLMEETVLEVARSFTAEDLIMGTNLQPVYEVAFDENKGTNYRLN